MTETVRRVPLEVVGEIVHPQEDLAGLLTRLLDDLPIGIILYDARAEFRVTYANPVIEDWTPPAVRPLVGRTLKEMFPGPQSDALHAALAGVVASGVAQNWRNFRFPPAGAGG